MLKTAKYAGITVHSEKMASLGELTAGYLMKFKPVKFR
jgi:hypothetical protein